MLDAVQDLSNRGYQAVYIILDDHPPMGRCREDVLNDFLPQILHIRKAANISLFGSGQGRDIEGIVVNDLCGGLEKLPNSYLWRYSLHPGLWCVQSLLDVLGVLDNYLTDHNQRTAWAFERVGGGCEALFEGDSFNASFRIAAPVLTASQVDRINTEVVRWIGWMSRSIGGVFGGSAAWERISQRYDFVNHYYGGPYPMIWRGVMEKGNPNPEFSRFCRYFLKYELRQAVNAIPDRHH